jgi:hypothetical protein
VLLREWLDYATDRVPLIYHEQSERRGVVQEDPAEDAVQRPRPFYRREVESQPWLIARPGATRP